MKKFILYALTLVVLNSCTDAIFAPDGILTDGSVIYIADREGYTVSVYETLSGKISHTILFDAPVTDMLVSADKLWCTTDGGRVYKVNKTSYIIEEMLLLNGHLSALTMDTQGFLWVSDRFKGVVYKIDPQTLHIVSTTDAGREPCDLFVNGHHLYVLNNLPAQAATDYPIATALHIIDTSTGKKIKEILLPNGSTDAIALEPSSCGHYLYVSHLLSRYQLPATQITRGWICTNALSIVDLEKQELYSTVLLDAVDRGAANPGAIRVSNEGNIYVALRGTDEIIEIDEHGMLNRLDSLYNESSANMVDPANIVSFLHNLRAYRKTGGKGLRAMDLYEEKPVFASYFTGEVKDFGGKIHYTKGRPVTSTPEGRGEMHFADANLCYQGWLSCVSCHPDGRTDGLNWDQMNDGICNPKNTKSLLFSHQTPPVMISGIRKDAETAVRAGFKHINFREVNEEIAREVDLYLMSLRPVASPYREEKKIKEGKDLFESYCATCHNGPYHTNGKSYEAPWNEDPQVKTFDVPSLVELWRTAPYLYDGRASTLDHNDIFHFTNRKFTEAEKAMLIAYMMTL